MRPPEKDSKAILKDQSPVEEQISSLHAGWGLEMGTLKATRSIGFYLKNWTPCFLPCACRIGVCLPAPISVLQIYVQLHLQEIQQLCPLLTQGSHIPTHR